VQKGNIVELKFPKHINFTLEHNPHSLLYEEVEYWLDNAMYCEVLPEDRDEMIKTGEIWELHWYPNTPVSFSCVAAATLDRVLQVANMDEE
jgi:hypothetical protein